MNADVAQIVNLAVDLGKIGAGLEVKTSQVVRKASTDVEAQAKARTAVDTGYLRNSIGSDYGRDRGLVYGDTGPTANYGAHLEYGTIRSAPQPYMGPAAEAVEPSFIKAVEKVVGL